MPSHLIDNSKFWKQMLPPHCGVRRAPRCQSASTGKYPLWAMVFLAPLKMFSATSSVLGAGSELARAWQFCQLNEFATAVDLFKAIQAKVQKAPLPH